MSGRTARGVLGVPKRPRRRVPRRLQWGVPIHLRGVVGCQIGGELVCVGEREGERKGKRGSGD